MSKGQADTLHKAQFGDVPVGTFFFKDNGLFQKIPEVKIFEHSHGLVTVNCLEFDIYGAGYNGFDRTAEIDFFHNTIVDEFRKSRR